MSSLSVTPSNASTDLVAAYGMNEGAGTVVGDDSGNGNTGAAAGTSWVPGKYGQALAFDGTTSLVTVASSASLKPVAGFTAEAWVNLADTGKRPVLAKDAGGRPGYALTASNGAHRDDRPPAGYVNTGPIKKAQALNAIPPNTWTHLATTYDGSRLRLYVNGVLARQTSVSGAIRPGDGPLYIGGYPAWGARFKGAIDEVRVYNLARTAEQIQADMTIPITPPDPRPTQPTGLTARPNEGLSATIRLNWTGSTDNTGVDHYDIHRSTVSGFTPSAATFAGRQTPQEFLEFWDEGLASGVYYYRVVAVDTLGQESEPSAQAQATATALGDPPTGTTTIAGGGRIGYAEIRTTNRPEAFWGLSHFQVHRSSTPGFIPGPRTRIATGISSPYQDFPLAPGTYYYRYVPVDLAGQTGPASNELTAHVPDTAPSPPGSPTTESAAGRVTVSWTAATDDFGVTGYEVYRSRQNGFVLGTASTLVGTTGADTLSLVDTGLSASRYYYRIRAIDGGDQAGDLSDTVPADPTTCPPEDCLAAAYGMNEGTGTAVGDASANSNTGTAAGTTWATGKYGGALAFTGLESEVRVEDAPALRMDDALTMEAWVYPTGTEQGQSIIRKATVQFGSFDHEFLLFADTNDSSGVFVGPNASIGNSNGIGVAVEDALPLNQWSHLAATFDGVHIRIYVNGVFIRQSGETATPIRLGGFPLFLGGFSYAGLIDEVRLYSTALTEAQIQADMNTPV